MTTYIHLYNYNSRFNDVINLEKITFSTTMEDKINTIKTDFILMSSRNVFIISAIV